MLLYYIISQKKEELTFIEPSEENVELISKTITEFKKHCITTEILRKAIDKIEDERLKLKLKDIYNCYEEFQKRMSDEYIEENDILSILPKKLNEEKIFFNKNVFIDEFSGFTMQEYAVVESILKQAKELTITIASDDLENMSEEYLFYTNNKTAQKLIELAKKNKINIQTPIYLGNTYRFKNKELKILEENLFTFPPKFEIEKPEHIHLYLNSNPYTETEKVATTITNLVRNHNYKYRDIAVITKKTDEYSALIKAIFRSYDIPNFIDEKKELSQNIVIRYILSIIEILAKGWKTENVLSAIKTGFFPITLQEEYDIEEYVISWGIKGKKWYENDWVYGLTTDKKEKINEIRKKIVNPIIHLKESLGKAKTVYELSTKIYEFLREIKIDTTLEEKTQRLQQLGEIETAKEYKASLDVAIQILDDLVLVLGAEKISYEKALKLLKIGFSGNMLGAIPATLDQVIVGDVERSRSHKVRAVFILGINDGVFPSNQKDEGFLSDIDRENLKKKGMELAKNSMENLYEEQFLIYKAFSIAEEELYLSYTSSDNEGNSTRPSSFIKKVKKIFPNIEEKSDIIQEDLEIANKQITFNNLLIALQTNKVDEIWQTVLEIYKEDEKWNKKLEVALKGKEETNIPSPINSSNIKKMYGNTLKTSISKLEQYQKCPFSFYLKYGLKLKEPPEFNLKTIDTGTFMHEVISQFFTNIEENNIDYKNLEKSKIIKLIKKIIQEELSLSKNDLFKSTPKFQNLTRRLEKLIEKAIFYIIEQLKNSDFNIAGTEIEFSKESKYKPITLTLETGEKIEVTGKIDRIDIAKDEKGKYIRIIDYKSSAKSLDYGEILAGIQIQLLTYLDAVTYLEEALPAGVFYFGLIDNLINIKKNKTDEEIEREIKKQFKLKGILLADIHVVRMMDKRIENGYSDIIPAYVDKEGVLNQTRSNVVTLEEFQNLQKHIKKIIKQISREILSGNIIMKPFKDKSKKTACEYCPYKSICNFAPNKKGNEYFYIRQMKKEELLEKIKEE